MCVYVHVSVCTHGRQKRALVCGDRIRVSCEPPNACAGNPAQILHKSSKYSSLLSQLSGPGISSFPC